MPDNPIKVFISYAHESDIFRESIKTLATWLNYYGKQRIKVTTDHIHQNRPPELGWQVWMEDQIEESDIVLIVCTPKYIARFRKKEEPDTGLGVTFEGAIITTQLYNIQLKNSKFHPIIPEGGNKKNVPSILQPFFNFLSFPDKNENILQCILNENPTLEDQLLEETIVKEIIIHNIPKEQSMLPAIHTLVRHFLLLSDLEKIEIAKRLNIFKESYLSIAPDERDKEIFKSVRESNLLVQLWDETHKLNPFDTINNPFNILK